MKEQLSFFEWEPDVDRYEFDFELRFPDIVIALHEHSGYATLPWRKAGFVVIQIDLKLGIDIYDWDYQKIDPKRVVGVMAFPECTDFTISGNQFWEEKDQSGQTEESLELVKKDLEVIKHFNPDWWFIENPVGRLASLLPELDDFGPWYFHPYEYGDPWKKKTGLFGKFKPPIKNPVRPIQIIAGNGDKYSPIHYYTWGSSENTKTIRSVTPPGFSKAFFKANCIVKKQEN